MVKTESKTIFFFQPKKSSLLFTQPNTNSNHYEKHGT